MMQTHMFGHTYLYTVWPENFNYNMYRYTYSWIHACMDSHLDTCMHGQSLGHMHAWTVTWTHA